MPNHVITKIEDAELAAEFEADLEEGERPTETAEVTGEVL